MPDLVRTVGRYGILGELGRGGMAVVYLARQLDLDRLVALKELAAFRAADPDFARRFVRESRLAGSLTHPNVITVLDYFEHDGTPYIAMEYLERGSLRPHIGRMTLAQIGGALEGLLAGLAAAEQLAIVHRDLKPENVMVTSAGGVKIADFGIAKATQAADTGAFVTATGMAVGTPPYMAPEQAMAKDIGPWTDLYSVGCMVYEMLTGRPPFHDAGEPMAIMLRHITEPLPPACEVADVDPDLSAWVERLMVKDPHARPRSAAAAWDELEELLLDKLGPRWRRDARLPELRPTGAPEAAPTRVPGPATPPPSAPQSAPEGIDLEATGPDSPDLLVKAEPPAAHAVAARAVLLAHCSAVALIAGLLIPIVATGPDRWNAFAVLSPFEAAGALVATWLLARRLSAARISVPFAGGALLGIGVLSSVASLALVKFTVERLPSASIVLALLVLLGGLAALAAGIDCVRSGPRGEPTPAADPAPLVLGLVGTGLASVAIFVDYDGFSSLWTELLETESAEFFFEPAIAAVAMLVGLLLLGTLQRFAAGLLLSVGAAATLHYLGLVVAAWRAIGEVGEVRAAGFVGVVGGALVVAAGALRDRMTARP